MKLRINPVTKQPEPDFCQRCGEQVDPDKAVWLELNWNTQEWSAEGSVPEEESQGCFPFGAACARAVLKAGGIFEIFKRRK